ncbi:MAG: hypothetical protein GEV11_28305 [Streptosporangiales bacterium]|nr:hypothetical protein [Streptosporangiales bacterium]
MTQTSSERRPNTRVRSVLLAVACTVMTALSALAVVGGEPLGYAGLLLFGGGGLFLLYASRSDARRRTRAATDPALRHGTVAGAERHTGAPAGVVCPAGRGAILPVLAGCAAFAAAGGLLLYGAVAEGRAGLALPGVLALAVFGGFGALTVPRVFGPPTGILLLPEGIFCRMPAGTAWLPWDTIEGIALGANRNQRWLAFTLRRGAEGAVLTGPARWFRVPNRLFGMDVGYPGQGLAQPPEDVLALLVRLHGDPGLRAQLRDPSIVDSLRRPDASAWRRW